MSSTDLFTIVKIYLLVQMLKEVIAPGDQGQLVDLVDAFTPFLALSADPVSENSNRLIIQMCRKNLRILYY